MATVTWTFTNSFEGYTFREVIVAGDGSASRSHVSGAIRVQVALTSTPGPIQGFNELSGIGAPITGGDTIELDISATSDAVNMSTQLRAVYTDATQDVIQSNSNNNARTITLTLTGGKVLDTIEIRFSNEGASPVSSHTRDILEIRLITSVAFSGTGERPLELDLDLYDGNRIWITKWKNAGLYIESYTGGLSLENSYPIATGTTASIFEIENRTYYITPYAPPFFGTASLSNIVYIFGRWDDSGIAHLAKSTDAGSSFSDIGDSATWGTGWVGGFLADDISTLYAFINGASRGLYRSLDGGTTWALLSSLPFDVEPHGISKHPDGRILIINRGTGAQMAAYAEGPDYSSWIDATGSPAFPQAGGGANAVAWIT